MDSSSNMLGSKLVKNESFNATEKSFKRRSLLFSETNEESKEFCPLFTTSSNIPASQLMQGIDDETLHSVENSEFSVDEFSSCTDFDWISTFDLGDIESILED